MRETNTSYIGICKGDSGSGHWINIDWSNEQNGNEETEGNTELERSVLAAVATRGFGGPCGMDAFMYGRRDNAISVSLSKRITHGKILSWIKEKAQICDNENGGCFGI